MIEIRPGNITGLLIQKIEFHKDDRGSLFEIFRQDELGAPGSALVQPAMAYASYTKSNVCRGPHEHSDQTDIFVFAEREFRLYCWDNRPHSTTYGNRFVVIVGGLSPQRVIVPPGVVHAYKNISDELALVLNAPDKLYAGWNKNQPVDEIRHEEDETDPFWKDMLNYDQS